MASSRTVMCVAMMSLLLLASVTEAAWLRSRSNADLAPNMTSKAERTIKMHDQVSNKAVAAVLNTQNAASRTMNGTHDTVRLDADANVIKYAANSTDDDDEADGADEINGTAVAENDTDQDDELDNSTLNETDNSSDDDDELDNSTINDTDDNSSDDDDELDNSTLNDTNDDDVDDMDEQAGQLKDVSFLTSVKSALSLIQVSSKRSLRIASSNRFLSVPKDDERELMAMDAAMEGNGQDEFGSTQFAGGNAAEAPVMPTESDVDDSAGSFAAELKAVASTSSTQGDVKAVMASDPNPTKAATIGSEKAGHGSTEPAPTAKGATESLATPKITREIAMPGKVTKANVAKGASKGSKHGAGNQTLSASAAKSSHKMTQATQAAHAHDVPQHAKVTSPALVSEKDKRDSESDDGEDVNAASDVDGTDEKEMQNETLSVAGQKRASGVKHTAKANNTVDDDDDDDDDENKNEDENDNSTLDTDGPLEDPVPSDSPTNAKANPLKLVGNHPKPSGRKAAPLIASSESTKFDEKLPLVALQKRSSGPHENASLVASRSK